MLLWKNERILFVLRFLLIFTVLSILFFMNLNIYDTFIIKHEGKEVEYKIKLNVTLLKQFSTGFFYNGVRQIFSKFTG